MEINRNKVSYALDLENAEVVFAATDKADMIVAELIASAYGPDGDIALVVLDSVLSVRTASETMEQLKETLTEQLDKTLVEWGGKPA